MSRAESFVMIASTSTPRSLALAPSQTGQTGLPFAVQAILGGALEIFIHSIEGLRDRLGKLR